jgi:uracil-DNA glycosylase family 4
MFTGDKSGDFLYRALFETGFASQPESAHLDDGLQLFDAYITTSAHCAPPENKPSREEIAACRPFLERELDLLSNLKAVVALGRVAFDNYLAILQTRGSIARRTEFEFGHNRALVTGHGQPILIGSYHPSQQNTSTGKLTATMLRDVFTHAKRLLKT